MSYFLNMEPMTMHEASPRDLFEIQISCDRDLGRARQFLANLQRLSAHE
jgi:hypothetical protein